MTNDIKIDSNNQWQSLRTLPAKKRLDAIINHQTPLKLVRAIGTYDLLTLIKDVGAEDALEVVELLAPDQVQEILDLEIWPAEKLDPRRAGHYFSLLFSANEQSAVAQMAGLDIELIGLMLKTVSDIYDLSQGEDVGDYPEIYFKSPDDRFLVCFSNRHEDRALSQSLKLFLERMCERNVKKVLTILESVRFEMASGLEEASLRWRNNRLLDMGILPREERLELFTPITLGQLKSARAASTFVAAPSDSKSLVLAMAENSNSAYPFLSHGLSGCSDQFKETFWQWLAHISVNMHASISDDFGDAAGVKATCDYVKSLMEFGVFHAALGRIDQAQAAIEKMSPKNLIRLGRTTLVAIRQRLSKNKLNKAFIFGKNFTHADSPLREVARAISLAEPRYYEGLLDPKKLTVRFFANLTEVNATLKAVDELLFRAAFVGECGLGFSEEAMINKGNLSHSNILARFLINSFLGDTDLLSEVGAKKVAQVFDEKNVLRKDFSQFCEALIKDVCVKAQNKSLEQNNPAIDLERALNFQNVVLINLSQNSELLLRA